MGTLQKLKAYFGMVPAESTTATTSMTWTTRRAADYRRLRRPGYLADEDDYDPYPEPRAGSTPARVPRRCRDDDRYDERRPTRRPSSAAPTPARPRSGLGPRRRCRAPWPWSRVASRRRGRGRAGGRQPTGYPMGRIVTLHPTSFAEARTIGEHYRDGTPVIMNLTELDDADATRLVDFAAGLAFAMRGSMDKVTNKVFLISPPNLDPTAEDKRRIAEGGLLNRS